MNALLTQFITESRGLVEDASRALLALEQAPENTSQLDALFRAVHTVKGASGLFDIAPFTQAVHAGEDVLDAVRMGELTFTAVLADLLLNLLDNVSEWLEQLETREELSPEAARISAELSGILRGYLADGPVLSPDEAPAADGTGSQMPAFHRVTYRPEANCFFSGDDPLRTALTTPGLLRVDCLAPASWPAPGDMDPFQAALGFQVISDAAPQAILDHYLYVDDQITMEPVTDAPASAGPIPPSLAADLIAAQRRLIANGGNTVHLETARTVLTRVARYLGVTELAGSLKEIDVQADDAADQLDRLADALLTTLTDAAPSAVPALTEPEPAPVAAPVGPLRTSSIRVDADRIDLLMNLAGELIVAKNALPYLSRRAEEIEGARGLAREIKAQHDVINRIADELQGAVMRIRMVPVGTVLGRFNRLVRDLSRKLEKRIRLEISGEETEADKAVVEELADPMVHLIRNALDHGLETPAERRAAGKPEEGVIRIAAYQRDENVVIEITDDGRGIDVERVKAKALDRGMVNASDLETMSDADALQLILLPGLSTRDQTTDLSGRGVGMDVVANLVRRLGGTIGLQSTLGEGTCVRMTLPLSMAVQHLMMIEVAEGLYGVPIDSVIESQRRPASAIHRHRDEEMIVLRDRMIPLLRLRSLFGCPAETDTDEINILVVELDGSEVGLVVDRFHAGVDVIVKPMEGILAGATCFSGTALLGDGSVLLALNLSEVIVCRWN